MEYSIYFDNDGANKTISAALEELENTFFIEDSSSESEKNISDDHEIMSDEEIESINKNFENLHLSNFEFAENSDNYIEDSVYDDLKLKVKRFLKMGNICVILIVLRKLGTKGFLHV